MMLAAGKEVLVRIHHLPHSDAVELTGYGAAVLVILFFVLMLVLSRIAGAIEDAVKEFRQARLGRKY